MDDCHFSYITKLEKEKRKKKKKTWVIEVPVVIFKILNF
jgi:hypothetical protein